ncbi:MAG: ABC transporter permease, partial [Bryobacteraceae bacterium]
MIRDLLWAIRWLRKNPLFTVAITAILALGIGANTAVFSVVDAVLLRPLPYRSSSRLVRLEETSPKIATVGISAAECLEWRTRTDLFQKVMPYMKDVVTMTGIGEPVQIVALRTSVDLFPTLGVRARLGRALVDSDDKFNTTNIAVLSDRMWRRLFHADPGIVGRGITLSGNVYTVVGVMPVEFQFPSSDIELWTPLHLAPASTTWVDVVARMRNGVSLAQLRSAMGIVARRLEREDPRRKA